MLGQYMAAWLAQPVLPVCPLVSLLKMDEPVSYQVPAEQRPIYEQYLGALSGYRQATGRPLDIGLVPRVQAIAEGYGYTPEQAADIESARRGYGAAQQQYGLLGGSPLALLLVWRTTWQTPEEQAQQTMWRGMLAPSIRGGGADPVATEAIVDSLRKKYP